MARPSGAFALCGGGCQELTNAYAQALMAFGATGRRLRKASGGWENVLSPVWVAICCAAWRGRRYVGFLVLLRAQLVGRLRERDLY